MEKERTVVAVVPVNIIFWQNIWICNASVVEKRFKILNVSISYRRVVDLDEFRRNRRGGM